MRFVKTLKNQGVFKLLAIMLATVIIGVIVWQCSCSGSRMKILEEGYFQYAVVGKEWPDPDKKTGKVIAIVGLTELGKVQEVIDIPEELAGKRVVHLGYKNDRYFYADVYHSIESENLKKIYIPSSVSRVWESALSHFTELQVMICGVEKLAFSQHGFNSGSEFYFCNNAVYEEFWWDGGTGWSVFEGALNVANIAFKNNYSDEINGGYYRIDNIDVGEKILEPSDMRRDGYTFAGWYTEPECVNLWDFSKEAFSNHDFENDVREKPEDNEGDEVKQLCLYAGWEEIK